MRERVWNRWRRALAMLIALLLAIEALPLQTLAAPSRGGYIPLIVSEDEDEEESEIDYAEDAELLDDRPLLAAGLSARALRASGSNATLSNALPLATPYVAFRQASGGYAPWTGAGG